MTIKKSRPFYEVFLERVIRIDAVQRHRKAAMKHDKRTAQFFDTGHRPGPFGEFKWRLKDPASGDWESAPLSLAMEQAWKAAVTEWRKLIAELANGEMIATGLHPATGDRHNMDRAEWTRTGSVIDVQQGDLIEGFYGRRYGEHTVLRRTIVVHVVRKRREKKPRGHSYDWDAAWTFAKRLRSKKKWNWAQHRQDKKQPLPALHKTVEETIAEWFAARGSVPDISDIRQIITGPLYAGRLTRGKRKH